MVLNRSIDEDLFFIISLSGESPTHRRYKPTSITPKIFYLSYNNER